MTDSHVVAVIPARMGSSRFPGKPLASILGIPMIEHVYRRTEMAVVVDAAYVATCDPEIREAVEGFGGRVVITSSTHERASDRVAEANDQLGADVVVMVQGDEPMVTASTIDAAAGPLLEEADVQCVNLIAAIRSEERFLDRNTIKVVKDCNSNAVFFSREPIPSTHVLGWKGVRAFKQVCVISFRRDVLQAYANLSPTPLEQAESIDMLRLIEHGYRIRLVETNVATEAVDTPADLERVETLLAGDPLTATYTSVNRDVKS